MIRAFDTPPEVPPRHPDAPVTEPSTMGAFAQIMYGHGEYHWRMKTEWREVPPGCAWELYVEPAAYHRARAAVWFTFPLGIYVDIMPLIL